MSMEGAVVLGTRALLIAKNRKGGAGDAQVTGCWPR